MFAFRVFLVCIFPHSDRIRRFTEEISVFSPNAEKTETFYAVIEKPLQVQDVVSIVLYGTALLTYVDNKLWRFRIFACLTIMLNRFGVTLCRFRITLYGFTITLCGFRITLCGFGIIAFCSFGIALFGFKITLCDFS